MALRLDQLFPPRQVAQNRQPGCGLDLWLAEFKVTGSTDAVEYDTGDLQVGIELLIAKYLGGHAACYLGGIGDQDHGGFQQFGQLGG